MKFYKEKFIDIMAELPTLFAEHFKIIKDPDYKQLSIDWGKYAELEQLGLLHILTVRNERDELVGYFFNIVMPHILYNNILHGFSDIYFILPEYRRGFFGTKFIKENSKMLKALGCAKQVMTVNSAYAMIGKILTFLGFKPYEQSYTKRLG